MKNVSNGFYVELDELQKKDQDANFGFLGNTDVTSESNAYNFLHGCCDEFAAMLSYLYGYNIEAVRNGVGRLIHAYCISEVNGEKAYIDIRGITTDAALFFDEFKNELYFSPDGDIYVEDEDGYDVVAGREIWPNNDELFDGDYEGWVDNEIVTFIKVNSRYYDLNLFKENLFMKTLKAWPEGLPITQYLKVGDKVDKAMYEHFLNIMPPHYNCGGLLQVGGACNAIKDENGVMRNTYLTFGKDSENDAWVFKGECFSGVWVNRNPELEPKAEVPVSRPLRFDVSVRQTRFATLSVEAYSREEALDIASDAVRSDIVVWDDGPLSFTKAMAIESSSRPERREEKNTSLDVNIKQAEAIKQSHVASNKNNLKEVNKER